MGGQKYDYREYLARLGERRDALLAEFDGEVPWDHPEFWVDVDWVSADTKGILAFDEATVDAARTAALVGWRKRAIEYREPVPEDLASSCMFSALFAKVLFGGRIVGNDGHLFNLVDGDVLDLNAGAADVVRLGDGAYEIDGDFVEYDEMLLEQLRSNYPRVKAWVTEFVATHVPAPKGP